MLESTTKQKHIPFIARFCESVLRMDKVELREQIAGLYTSFEARNMDTQARHWLADFGFGVSQCLPIFVQGAMMSPGEVFTIEQPEAQLHPTAQLELGSFFGSLWKERGVASIIETHSSNILLRLRKLVRAGELSPSDVGVAYVHVKDGVTQVANMLVKPDGELDGHLPMEFFGADLFEALEFNAIPRPEDS
jgi:predicted ATPase